MRYKIYGIEAVRCKLELIMLQRDSQLLLEQMYRAMLRGDHAEYLRLGEEIEKCNAALDILEQRYFEDAPYVHMPWYRRVMKWLVG